MTQYTPEQARELADTPMHMSVEPLREALRSLADQLEQALSHPKSMAAAPNVMNMRVIEFLEQIARSTTRSSGMMMQNLGREASVLAVELRAAAPAVPAPGASAEPLIFDDFPEFHAEGMGCGLEDRNITDRYEAMRYGWDQALESVALTITGFLSDLPQAAPVAQLSEPTDQQMDVIYRDVWTTVPHAKRLFEFGRRVFALAAAPTTPKE